MKYQEAHSLSLCVYIYIYITYVYLNSRKKYHSHINPADLFLGPCCTISSFASENSGADLTRLTLVSKHPSGRRAEARQVEGPTTQPSVHGCLFFGGVLNWGISKTMGFMTWMIWIATGYSQLKQANKPFPTIRNIFVDNSLHNFWEPLG